MQGVRCDAICKRWSGSAVLEYLAGGVAPAPQLEAVRPPLFAIDDLREPEASTLRRHRLSAATFLHPHRIPTWALKPTGQGATRLFAR